MFREFLIYGIIGVVSKLQQIFLLPLLTSIMPIGEIGFIALVLSSVSLGTVLISFQIYSSIDAFYFENQSEKFIHSIFGIQTLLSLGILIIILIIFPILKLFIAIDNILVFIALGLIVVQIPNLYFQFVYRLQNKIYIYVTIVILPLILDFILKIYILYNYTSFSAYNYLSTGIFSGLFGFFLILIIRKGKFISFRKITIFKEIIDYSKNITIKNLNQFLYTLSDRFLINYYLNKNSVGIYQITNQLTSPIQLLHVAGSQASTPHILKNFHHQNNNELNKVTNIWSRFAGHIILIYSFLINPMSNLFVSNKLDIDPIFFWLLLLAFIPGLYFSQTVFALIATKKSNKIMLSTLWAGLINFFLNIILIQKIGFISAYLSKIISVYLLLILIIYYHNRSDFIIKIDLSRISFHFVVLITLSTFLFFYAGFNNLLVGFIFLLISIVLYEIFCKYFVYNIWYKLKQ